jgi:hypothetical protein
MVQEVLTVQEVQEVLTVQEVQEVLGSRFSGFRSEPLEPFEPFEPLELFSNVQPFDQIRVSLGVFELEVIEQPAALADEHQEAAAGMVILRVRFEMLGQIVDALAEDRDLNFW